MTAIGELAVCLGQQSQLDSEGIRQSQMAEDLADTNPQAMANAFIRMRRELTFLPVTSEVLVWYRIESAKLMEARDSEARNHEYAEQRRRRDAGEAMSVAQILNEAPELNGFMEPIRERLQRRANVEQSARQPRPIDGMTTDACPHCAGKLAATIPDLRRIFGPAQLRAMADRWDAEDTARNSEVTRMHEQQAAELRMPGTPKTRKKEVA